jgi:hypothetical protein
VVANSKKQTDGIASQCALTLTTSSRPRPKAAPCPNISIDEFDNISSDIAALRCEELAKMKMSYEAKGGSSTTEVYQKYRSHKSQEGNVSGTKVPPRGVKAAPDAHCFPIYQRLRLGVMS